MAIRNLQVVRDREMLEAAMLGLDAGRVVAGSLKYTGTSSDEFVTVQWDGYMQISREKFNEILAAIQK